MYTACIRYHYAYVYDQKTITLVSDTDPDTQTIAYCV